jgi:hypothetical protein
MSAPFRVIDAAMQALLPFPVSRLRRNRSRKRCDNGVVHWNIRHLSWHKLGSFYTSRAPELGSSYTSRRRASGWIRLYVTTPRAKLGSFYTSRRDMPLRRSRVNYFCRRSFLAVVARAISIRRRIASERDGLSLCCLAQFSIADLTVSGRRTVRTGSRPVAGRPGFLVTFSVDGLTMFW